MNKNSVEQKLVEIIEFLDIDRMPTYKEMAEYCGDYSLTNKVTRSGGINFWSKRLGMPIKKSETGLALAIEEDVKRTLENIGYRCELTSTKFPYDILVDGVLKVDVKVAKKTAVQNNYPVYSFRLSKRQQTCDLYIAVCLDEHEVSKTYIIPAHIMTDKVQLCISDVNSAYDKYLERWDLIKTFCDSFKKIN